MLEKLFQKLNKIPSWVSIVVLAVGCIVANVPNLLTFDSFVSVMIESIKEIYTSPVAVTVTPAFKWVTIIFMVIILYFIIELVAQGVFSWAVRSRYTNRGKKYYLVSVRYGMGLVQIVYGLYSLLSVYAPDVYFYSAEIVLFLLRTAVITMVYYGIRKECINDKFVFSLYNRLYTMYFIYHGAFNLLNLFTALLSSPIVVGDAISFAVSLAVVALVALALYFTLYKKLKKEQEEARKSFVLPQMPGNGSDDNDHEIFSGYGM